MTGKWDAKAAAGGAGTEPPGWVAAILAPAAPPEQFRVDRLTHGTFERGEAFSLLTIRIQSADDLDSLSFQRQTVVAYRAIADALTSRETRFPIRFWNFIPNINKPISDSLSRYMVFNAGRFSAFHDWYGEAKAFDRYLATASGVGHDCNELVIHCLAATSPGLPVENPRQVPSYRYSEHYGPLPPTFARATAVNLNPSGESILLVGGTASIRGECSLHHDDLTQQANETLHNLATVVRAGCVAHSDDDLTPHAEDRTWLRRFRQLRVYYVRPDDRANIAQILDGSGLNLDDIEWRRANLCRPELLVEIEGVAQLSRARSGAHVSISLARKRAALEA